MTIITLSVAIVIVVLSITLVLSALGRVQTTAGSQRWLAIALVLALIAVVVLQLSGERAVMNTPTAADPLQSFIASLPAQARGTDAEATRSQILRLVKKAGTPGGVDCEALMGQNAEFANTLEQMRVDIRQAVELANDQQATIEQLREENQRLQDQLGNRP